MVGRMDFIMVSEGFWKIHSWRGAALSLIHTCGSEREQLFVMLYSHTLDA
jgi:hypothetical protein